MSDTGEHRRLPFMAFHGDRATRKYRRNLPHWRQEGATYFVTIRLADSVPAQVLNVWKQEKWQWLSHRGIAAGVSGQNLRRALDQLSLDDRHTYRRYFDRKMERYLDQGAGQCFLRHSDCIRIVRERLLQFDCVEYDLGDFIIMPNHLHLLIVPLPGHKLETILQHFKGVTAFVCNRFLRREKSFWQREAYDHIVRDLAQRAAYRYYIACNPQRAAIVLDPAAYYRASWMDERLLD